MSDEEKPLLDRLSKMREWLDEAEEALVNGLRAVDTEERNYFAREVYSRIQRIPREEKKYPELAGAHTARFAQLAPILLYEFFWDPGENGRPKPTSYVTSALKPETVEALNAKLANE